MGDIKSAAEVIAQYDMPFFQYVYNSFPAGGDAGQHAILELAGICGRWRRDPLPDFSDQDMEQLKAFLNTNNML